MLANFLTHFALLEDPRSDRNQLYPIEEILIVSFFAILSGCDGWEDIEDYGNQKIEFLKKYGEFKNGTPSDDTFRRFYEALAPSQFGVCFRNWVNSLDKEKEQNTDDEESIAFDGKTARGSRNDTFGKKAIHTLSAFATSRGLCIGQVKTDEKSNEITAIPELLEMLDVKGATITIDAMGCQKEIAKKIIEKEADYIFGLKGNHGNLHKDVALFFEDHRLDEYFETVEKGHGRIETRRCYATENIDWLKEIHPHWENLQSIIMIESTREIRGHQTFERRFYISSCSANPEKLLKKIRAHWLVENSLHWVLDMSFNEDRSRIRDANSAANMVVIRHFAINALKKYKQKRQSIKRLRKIAGWNNDILDQIVQTIFS